MKSKVWFGIVLVSLAVASAQPYPVTVTSCGEPVTFTAAPERAVVFEANLLEVMLELGLKNSIAGVWTGGTDDASTKVQPPYREQARELRVISNEAWPPPGLEVVLGAEPDFVLSGWGYGFSEETGLTPAKLEQLGVAAYALSESCAKVGAPEPTTLRTLYRDIRNIGTIFGAAQRADDLIARLEARVAAVSIPATRTEPLRVFYYDSGEDSPFTAGKYGMPTGLIAQAGGENIFADVEKDWATVSWEEVVARDPEVILVMDSDWASFEDNLAFLRSIPELAGVSALQKEQFIRVTFKQMTPGLENVDALEAIAKGLQVAR